MRIPMRTVFLAAVLLLIPSLEQHAFAKPACLKPEQALSHLGSEVCVTAHVYRVVDTANGVHFLDVCSPDTPDDECHFFILSFTRDEASVGDLERLVDRTISVRGTVHTIQGRAEIVLSSRTQLHGGKEKFRPNPQLVKGFSAEDGGQAFSAKNGSGGQHGVHFSHRGR